MSCPTSGRTRSGSTPARTMRFGSSSLAACSIVSSGVSAPKYRDPPAARAEREAEGHRAEIVLFTRQTGNERDRPEPPSPAARESKHAPAQQLEAKCSCAIDASPRSQRRPSSSRNGSTTSERTVSTVAAARRSSRIAWARGSSNASTAAVSSRARGLHRCPDLGPPRPVSTRECRRLGCGHASVEITPHRLHALQVVRRVEAQSAFRPRRVEQTVPALPRAQQLRAHAGAPAQLANPEHAGLAHGALYKICTNLDSIHEPCYRRHGQYLYRRCTSEDPGCSRRSSPHHRGPQLGPRRTRRVRPRRRRLRPRLRRDERRYPHRLRPRRRRRGLRDRRADREPGGVRDASDSDDDRARRGGAWQSLPWAQTWRSSPVRASRQRSSTRRLLPASSRH